ncbi:hypothetical protein [Actinoplanes sp. NPDC049316]|uniref:hypothetical protein n=1 Tax=Actinoplanes sp. NPDC049316 TaxID=3154727 RepID=UPI00341CB189
MTAPHHDDTYRPIAAERTSTPELRSAPSRQDPDAVSPARNGGPVPLLSVRTTVILVLAALVGVGAGVLAALAGQPVPAATIVGGGAAAAAIALFHSLIDQR